MQELNRESIVVGCNYHLKWASDWRMRFVLAEVQDNRARMITRNSKKDFWVNISDLVFIMSEHNVKKAKVILEKQIEQTH